MWIYAEGTFIWRHTFEGYSCFYSTISNSLLPGYHQVDTFLLLYPYIDVSPQCEIRNVKPSGYGQEYLKSLVE